jgi:hypothetical protein
MGPLHGVTMHSTLPPDARATSVFEILDARLAIALDDFVALLARHSGARALHDVPPARPRSYPPIRRNRSAIPRDSRSTSVPSRKVYTFVPGVGKVQETGSQTEQLVDCKVGGKTCDQLVTK